MANTQPEVIVVIPTYNEIQNLPLIVEQLFALEIDGLHILVVDDNSPDGTGQKAEELGQTYDGRVHVLHRTEKAGLGPAYVAGFKHAINMQPKYIIQMDADGSHQPKYIPEMLKIIQNYDLVIASRYLKGGGVDHSWGPLRKLLSWWANQVYVTLILHIPSTDATGGYRCWRRETLIGLDLDRIWSNGYVFQVEMAYLTYKLGFQIGELPIYFPDRQIGESKMDMRIAMEAALRTWQIRGRHHHLTPQDRRTNGYN